MKEQPKICAWKQVANNDLEKRVKGVKPLTFDDRKTPCYFCDGYKTKEQCGGYLRGK